MKSIKIYINFKKDKEKYCDNDNDDDNDNNYNIYYIIIMMTKKNVEDVTLLDTFTFGLT